MICVVDFWRAEPPCGFHRCVRSFMTDMAQAPCDVCHLDQKVRFFHHEMQPKREGHVE